MKRLPLLLVALSYLLALAANPALAQSRPPGAGPEIRIGDNVFLVPDKNARSITGWLIVLAGCADEAEGRCVGTAHYLEHLLFINRDNDHVSKVAFFADGSGNGWTTHRATAYFQRFPSRPATNAANLDRLIGHFAGLLSDLKVERAQADRERNVVLQEYHQNTGRNPFARFSIALNLALMPDEPLGQRVIGSPETINAFTLEAAQAFHSRWYARNNARIVLHGPIDTQAVAPLVARHLAALPDKPIPKHVWRDARNYGSGRQLLRTTDKDARQLGVYLEKIVTFDEPEAMRLETEAASAVLGGYLASQLKESPLDVLMERDEIVTSTRLSVGRIRDGTLRVSFWGVPADGVAPEKVIEAARVYIADIARKGLSQETVDRLKMRIANERALLAEQPQLYAQALTNWLSSHNSYEDWTSRATRGATVTQASVNRLLSLIAGPGREVAGVLMPGAPSARDTSNNRRDEAPPLPSADAPRRQGAQR